jgi:hypothetical protein
MLHGRLMLSRITPFILWLFTLAATSACAFGSAPPGPDHASQQPPNDPVELPATWTPTATIMVSPTATATLTPTETPLDPTSQAATATRSYREQVLPLLEEASLTLADLPPSYIEMPVDEYNTMRSMYRLQTGLDLATINAFTEERQGTIVMSMTFTHYRDEDLQTFDQEVLDIEGQVQTMLESLGADPSTQIEIWNTFPPVGDVHVAVRMRMDFLGQTIFYEAVSFRRQHVIASIYILRTPTAEAPYLPNLARVLDQRIQAVFQSEE